MHPLASDVYDTIMNCSEIEALVLEQNWLSNEGVKKTLAKYCKNDYATLNFIRDALYLCVNSFRFLKSGRGAVCRVPEENAATRWRLIKDLCDERTYNTALDERRNVPKQTPQRVAFLRMFMLDSLAPRLDAHVTTATNHLLKSPFCVHPKTGAIAVPFEVEHAAEFPITTPPRVE